MLKNKNKKDKYQPPAKKRIKIKNKEMNNPGRNSLSIWAPFTSYHRLGGLNRKLLSLTILEDVKSKIKIPVDPVSAS